MVCRDAPAVRRLLREGADPNTLTADNESLLTLAAHHGDTAIIKDLLAAGAARDHIGARLRLSPLQLAVARGKPGIVALLLPLADLELREPERGWTALFFAVSELAMRNESRSLTILRQLLTAGADPTQRDHAGRTAADLAEANGLPQHLDILSQYIDH